MAGTYVHHKPRFDVEDVEVSAISAGDDILLRITIRPSFDQYPCDQIAVLIPQKFREKIGQVNWLEGDIKERLKEFE